MKRSDWLNVLALTAGACLAMAACRDDDDRVQPSKSGGKVGASLPPGQAGAGGAKASGAGANAGGAGSVDAGGASGVDGGSPGFDALGGQGGSPGLGGAGGKEGESAVCYVETTYGDLGSPTGSAVAFKTNGGGILFTVTLDAGPPPDEFRLELYKGLGAFKNGLTTGVFPIAGAELDYGTCGVCPIIYENKDITKLYRGAYIATGGTVTLTSVDGNLIGDMKDVTMEHVVIDNGDFHSTPHNDGCITKIDALSFSAVIE